MQNNWAKELHRVLWLLFISISLGMLFNQLWLCVAIGSLGYITWTLWQLKRIHDWLVAEDSDGKEPPETVGFWGGVCDKIYYLQKNQKKTRERLQADVQYLRDSFASLSDAVVMVNEQGLIDWFNDAAIQNFALQYPGDLGQSIVNLLRSPEFIAYYESGDYEKGIDMPCPGSEERTLWVQISRFGRGNRLLFARDITEIQKLEQMRRDFTSNVSHELRTPLTVITGYIDNFSLYTDQLPALEKPLGQMAQNARRMEYLLRDLLELSRIESMPNERHKTAVSLSRLASVVVEESKAALTEEEPRHFELDIQDDIMIFGQGPELHSALLNLVVNACKYTENGGRIAVSCWSDTEGVHFSVKDDGIGIDPLEIPRLTERFYRADKSRAINTGGTGLGLAIVKHILQRHDAELYIESALGKGSLFVCHFPLRRVVEGESLAS